MSKEPNTLVSEEMPSTDGSGVQTEKVSAKRRQKAPFFQPTQDTRLHS